MQKKYFSRYREPLAKVGNLVETQIASYNWLIKEGLKNLFKEFSPIKDYSEKKFELEFADYQLDEPKFDEHHAKVNQLTYDTPLRVKVKLKNKIVGAEKEQEIFLADFPLMTPHGTFIINGNERVVVSQLARCFGVFFTENELQGKKYFGAKIIPATGAWIEFETETDGVIYVRIDRKRKFPVTSLVRVLADLANQPLTDAEILAHFAAEPSEIDYAKLSISKDHAKTVDDSFLEIYKRLRDSDLATVQNAREFLALLFSRERYDLSTVGRTRFNRRFGKPLLAEVRDVHTSHCGRVCPIHTPEGPGIGLILHLTNYARINEFGVIETPYRKVVDGKITEELVYLNALEEENHVIAHGATAWDADGRLEDEEVDVRIQGKPTTARRERVTLIDVAPYQAFSIATALIPFLEHDDATRALMGSNMQKQAIPCVQPEVPLVATGLERRVAADSGRLITAAKAGTVSAVDGQHLVIKEENGENRAYPLVNFMKTNDNTVFHHRPIVNLGQKVKTGEVLADTSSSVGGQLALGQNALVAFLSLDGQNYEDAIVISERLVRNAKFTSVHIESFPVSVRDTKLGPELTTHDIPNVGEAKLRNLDEDGIIRIGAEVGPGDILVGKITPKGETELTPEERLLRSIFGEKSRDVKDTSLRLPNGKKGKVVGIRVFSRERGDKLESGIIKKIHVEVAELRNVQVGDKLAGRHGNKGVISRVLPVEDMPYLADGTPLDIVLTPLGVPSRMNLGQIFEMHLGLAAHTLNYQAIVPPFAGATEDEIKEELVKANFQESGKVQLFDGGTGSAFDQEIAIGYMYILKLHHMVEDKIHMRSIGPYSLITQQPLGGKAQNGGQRFGEMEVW